jgi:predicted outer membrane protein
MDAMVKDHEKDLAEFQEEAREGTDPDLKEFAETTAKMIQEHRPRKLKASCNKSAQLRLVATRHLLNGVLLFLQTGQT